VRKALFVWRMSLSFNLYWNWFQHTTHCWYPILKPELDLNRLYLSPITTNRHFVLKTNFSIAGFAEVL
jgi:hypothetical protein